MDVDHGSSEIVRDPSSPACHVHRPVGVPTVGRVLGCPSPDFQFAFHQANPVYYGKHAWAKDLYGYCSREERDLSDRIWQRRFSAAGSRLVSWTTLTNSILRSGRKRISR